MRSPLLRNGVHRFSLRLILLAFSGVALFMLADKCLEMSANYALVKVGFHMVWDGKKRIDGQPGADPWLPAGMRGWIGNELFESATTVRAFHLPINRLEDEWIPFRIDQRRLGKICGLRHLEELTLTTIQCDSRDVQRISKLRKLKYLRFGRGSKGIDDAFLESLAKLPQLEQLYLADDCERPSSPPDDTFFKDFKRIRIKDAGVEALCSMPSLKRLAIHTDCQSNKPLVALIQSRQWESLVLIDATLTDEDAEALRGQSSLVHLHLASPKLTDRVVNVLGELKTVRSLWISNTSISPDGCIEIAAALPALETLVVRDDFWSFKIPGQIKSRAANGQLRVLTVGAAVHTPLPELLDIKSFHQYRE